MNIMKKINLSYLKTEFANKNIDILISSSSFEDRCLIIPDSFTNLVSKERRVFFNRNESSIAIQNAEIIQRLNKDKTKKVSLDTNNPIYTYHQIYSTIDSLVENHSNLVLAIDVTTFTHESLLILLKCIELRKDRFKQIFCLYVGAKEYSYNVDNVDEKWLSKGIIDIRSIIGYPGVTDFTAKNHLMILFGFELSRTRQIVKEYEYDYISIGFADIEKSIQTNHQRINFNRHRKLIKEYSNVKEFKFSCVDPYDTKKRILDYINQIPFKNSNTVIAPLNNKISTIGAGLAAIENESIQLTYAKPAIYNVEGYSKANDDIYIFDLVF
jgi:hypothetical protein